MVTLTAGTQLPNSAASTATASLNETDFLQLLTTQLEDQDPLNPQSPSDLAAELAQFSTATGVQSLNTTMNSTSGMQAASLVGQNVAVPGNSLVLGSSGSATGAFSLSAAATGVTVQVSNSAGNVLASLNLGAMAAGNQSFTWNGQGSSGQTEAAGTYSYTVSATGAQGASVTPTTYSVLPVTAVSLGGTSGPMLDFGGGVAPAALSSVAQVY
jgi:flagellar basal-body rod modification protein FlgD